MNPPADDHSYTTFKHLRFPGGVPEQAPVTTACSNKCAVKLCSTSWTHFNKN